MLLLKQEMVLNSRLGCQCKSYFQTDHKISRLRAYEARR